MFYLFRLIFIDNCRWWEKFRRRYAEVNCRCWTRMCRINTSIDFINIDDLNEIIRIKRKKQTNYLSIRSSSFRSFLI